MLSAPLVQVFAMISIQMRTGPNLRHGRLPSSGISTPPLWHIEAVEGASIPSTRQNFSRYLRLSSTLALS